jgi:hypothetical protein
MQTPSIITNHMTVLSGIIFLSLRHIHIHTHTSLVCCLPLDACCLWAFARPSVIPNFKYMSQYSNSSNAFDVMLFLLITNRDDTESHIFRHDLYFYADTRREAATIGFVVSCVMAPCSLCKWVPPFLWELVPPATGQMIRM